MCHPHPSSEAHDVEYVIRRMSVIASLVRVNVERRKDPMTRSELIRMHAQQQAWLYEMQAMNEQLAVMHRNRQMERSVARLERGMNRLGIHPSRSDRAVHRPDADDRAPRAVRGASESASSCANA